MAESFSRQKLRHAPQKEGVDEKSCVTPAGTSNELDVKNKWEEDTITHTHTGKYFTLFVFNVGLLRLTRRISFR